jgi:hypothetical protein
VGRDTDHVYVLFRAPLHAQKHNQLLRQSTVQLQLPTFHTMASPLSPLSEGRLNTKSPAPMPQVDSKIAVSPPNQAIHVPSNADESEIHWDEGPSSPFISQVQDDLENKLPQMPSIASPLSPSTAVVKAVQPIVDVVPSPAKSKSGSAFNILEDETCTFHTVRSTASASHSVVASPSKSFSRHSSTRSVRQEETTVTTQFKQEFQSRGATLPEERDFLETANTSIDELDNIDDTCFSTFSQVPNTDMTTFARLGQSPTRSFMSEQVSLECSIEC